ncbi:MAG: hypothetical protein KGL25_03395 [Gammaproteobacteria bacterium]|nr:hypothetical protein [Gammaproteobacteria bacterium]MDE2250432.1 hypothetical protein [Gammaproteobacteria bacterium]
MNARWRALALFCGSALALGPLRAADKAADADLLEYLGSVDSSEAGWHDYLASTDVDKLVKPGAARPAAPPVPPAPPANAPPAPNVPRKVKQS